MFAMVEDQLPCNESTRQSQALLVKINSPRSPRYGCAQGELAFSQSARTCKRTFFRGAAFIDISPCATELDPPLS
jgi:hypothetical protein